MINLDQNLTKKDLVEKHGTTLIYKIPGTNFEARVRSQDLLPSLGFILKSGGEIAPFGLSGITEGFSKTIFEYHYDTSLKLYEEVGRAHV